MRFLTLPNAALNTTTIPPSTSIDRFDQFNFESSITAPPKSHFYSGDWGSLCSDFIKDNWANSVDILLTSETVYEQESLPGLSSIIKCVLNRDGFA